MQQAASHSWLSALLPVLCGMPVLAGDTREAVSVTVGEEFTVSLESDPSTGNLWTLVTQDPLPAGLQLVSHAAAPGRSDAVGAAGTDDWTFAGCGLRDHPDGHQLHGRGRGVVRCRQPE
jgi:hypothetical protein